MAPHAPNMLHEGMNKPTALGRGMEPQDGVVQKILLRKMSITRDACPITGWGSPSLLSNVLGLSLSLQTVYMEILARCRAIRVQQKAFSCNLFLSGSSRDHQTRPEKHLSLCSFPDPNLPRGSRVLILTSTAPWQAPTGTSCL